ncbi:SDR family NAD(P)-dependent oxidoreductase [Streptomyces sp. NPDC004647]|uniref:SDR family NAD(P)-dependent oxidoreductase n=1 Tax=Streptomyces sp. NPDC004647 TaxID=3154671 RepID=UPI0033A7740C
MRIADTVALIAGGTSGLGLATARHLVKEGARVVLLARSEANGEAAVAELGTDVIDDGSHVSSHVISSFKALFPHVRPDGLYVVEDLHGSYWPALFGGSEDDLSDPEYTVGFLKTLVDGVNHEEFLDPGARPSQPTDSLIRGMHFYHNLAIIEKGANKEGSPIAELLRQVSRP